LFLFGKLGVDGLVGIIHIEKTNSYTISTLQYLEQIMSMLWRAKEYLKALYEYWIYMKSNYDQTYRLLKQ